MQGDVLMQEALLLGLSPVPQTGVLGDAVLGMEVLRCCPEAARTAAHAHAAGQAPLSAGALRSCCQTRLLLGWAARRAAGTRAEEVFQGSRS